MDIVYKTHNEPILTFKELKYGETFYFKDDEEMSPCLKIDDLTCVNLKWNRIYHNYVGGDFQQSQPVGRIKGYFYVEEVM